MYLNIPQKWVIIKNLWKDKLNLYPTIIQSSSSLFVQPPVFSVMQKLLNFHLQINKITKLENRYFHHILMLTSWINKFITTTWECICLKITAALFPVISHGRTQCLTPFAAYEFYSITKIQPRGRGIMNAPLQNP